MILELDKRWTCFFSLLPPERPRAHGALQQRWMFQTFQTQKHSLTKQSQKYAPESLSSHRKNIGFELR